MALTEFGAEPRADGSFAPHTVDRCAERAAARASTFRALLVRARLYEPDGLTPVELVEEIDAALARGDS